MADNNRPMPPQKIAQKLLIDDSEVKRITTNFRKKAAMLIDQEFVETSTPKTSSK